MEENKVDILATFVTLFACRYTKPLWKRDLHLKERISPQHEQIFFPLRVEIFSEERPPFGRGQKQFGQSCLPWKCINPS